MLPNTGYFSVFQIQKRRKSHSISDENIFSCNIQVVCWMDMAGVWGCVLHVFNFLYVHLKKPDAPVSSMPNRPRGIRTGENEGWVLTAACSELRTQEGSVGQGQQAFQHKSWIQPTSRYCRTLPGGPGASLPLGSLSMSRDQAKSKPSPP